MIKRVVGAILILINFLCVANPVVAKIDPASRIAFLERPSTFMDRQRTPLPPNPNRVVYMIPPQATDPRIDEEPKDHYVMFYKDAVPNGKLFVFLPGTYAAPMWYQYILDLAARLGYQVIGLEYPNIDNPHGIWTKSHSLDPDGKAKIFHARVTGENATDLTHVAPGNCIEQRLASLLSYLEKTHPSEGWSRFYNHNQINWQLICVAGHSQGAGMAAYISKLHAVDRVALFSGPTTRAGSWITAPGKTPPSRIFALYHSDELRYDNAMIRGYDALGILKFGPPISAESALPPYNQSHLIQLGLPPAVPDSATLSRMAGHCSVAGDQATPKLLNGMPAYIPAWSYVLGGSPQ